MAKIYVVTREQVIDSQDMIVNTSVDQVFQNDGTVSEQEFENMVKKYCARMKRFTGDDHEYNIRESRSVMSVVEEDENRIFNGQL